MKISSTKQEAAQFISTTRMWLCAPNLVAWETDPGDTVVFDGPKWAIKNISAHWVFSSGNKFSKIWDLWGNSSTKQKLCNLHYYLTFYAPLSVLWGRSLTSLRNPNMQRGEDKHLDAVPRSQNDGIPYKQYFRRNVLNLVIVCHGCMRSENT